MTRNRNILLFALVLSLLFNFFFIVGVLGGQGARTDDAPDRLTREVADALQLDESQAQVFAQLQTRLREESAVYDQAIALARQELWAELERDSIDPERIQSCLDQEADLRRQSRLAAGEKLREFMATLSPGQRQRFMQQLRHAPPSARRRQRMLERFDTNRDGRLDQAERAAAHRQLEARHGRFPGRGDRDGAWRGPRPGGPGGPGGPGRPARRSERFFLNRFDSNHNGRLDPEERPALLKWLTEEEEPPPPPPGP